MKRKATVNRPGLYLLLVVLSAVSIYVFYLLFLKEFKPPIFFPLNDPSATYTIQNQNNLYSLEYQGSQALGTEGQLATVSVLVGTTPINLSRYIGKRITINGTPMRYSTRQCIQKNCTPIPNSVVVDIYEVNEVE